MLSILNPNFFVYSQIVGSSSDEQQKMFGRHFEIEDELVSRISRTSIDVLKANYRVWKSSWVFFVCKENSMFFCSRLILSVDLLIHDFIQDDLSNEEWRLLVKLKNLFKIQ